MKLNRRAVLQQIGVTLAALGISQSDWIRWGDRYRRAIAQPTSRKLAVLIGINQYPDSAFKTKQDGVPLAGCVTDVELQRELLIHRFGFQPSDIVTLTNEQATRAAIQTTFLEHLTNQAQPDDVVVVHFSGFGSQLQVQHGEEQRIEKALVPVDGHLPQAPDDRLLDLPLTSLWLLLDSLRTDQVTTVLDTSYAPPDRFVHSSLHERSRAIVPQGVLSEAELSFQTEQFERLKVSRKKWLTQYETGAHKGIILSAVQPGGFAVETDWDGFSTGLFTYALTQQLWNTTPATTLRIVLSRVSASVEQKIGLGQNPDLQGELATDPRLVPYGLSVPPDTTADGIVTQVDSDTVQLWLGGLAAPSLIQYVSGSVVAVVPSASTQLGQPNQAEQPANPSTPEAPDAAANEAAAAPADTSATSPYSSWLYQVRSRNGITVTAKRVTGSATAATGASIDRPHVGDRALDVVRVLPKSLRLTIALDDQLERIERVDATSAFSGLTSVASVVNADHPADCFFGKTKDVLNRLPVEPILQPLADAAENEAPVKSKSAAPIPKAGYALFSLGRAAIPQTVKDEDEAVKNAITRLTPSLRTLLAIKLLRLTINPTASRLAVRATLESLAPKPQLLIQQQTNRSEPIVPESKVMPLMVTNGDLPQVPIGSRIQYRLTNEGDRPLYFVLIGWDSDGQVVFYPTPPATTGAINSPPTDDDRQGMIPAAGMASIPAPTIPTQWVVSAPRGFGEAYVVVSEAPLTRTFDTLPDTLQAVSNSQKLGGLSQPLNVVKALLADLSAASHTHTADLSFPADHYVLHRAAWVTFRFVYEIV